MAETATLSAISMQDGIVSQDKTMPTTRSNFSIATILGMEGRAESLPSSPVLPSLTMNFDPATIVPLSSPLCSNNSPRCSIATSAPSLLPVDVVSSNNYVANWSRRHLPLGDFSERFFHWKDNDNEDDKMDIADRDLDAAEGGEAAEGRCTACPAGSAAPARHGSDARGGVWPA